MKQNELTEYMNVAVKNLVGNISSCTIKESMFLFGVKKHALAAAAKRSLQEANGVHIPVFLIASITNTCNLFCKGCYARADGMCGKSDKKLLTAAQWNRIFSQAEDAGISFCLLAGGEPLMRRDIIATAATHRRMVFPMFTNGTMITNDYARFFYHHRNLVPVMSFEGDRNTTDVRRGTGTYDLLLHAAELFYRRGILWGASITLTTRNIDEVTSDAFIGNLYRHGARLVFYIEYVPAVPGTESLAPGESERTKLSERTTALRKSYRGMVLLGFPGDEKFLGGCIAGGRAFFHINPYGGAEPCPFSPYSDVNVAETSLLQALRSPLFLALRENHLTGAPHTGGCALFEQNNLVRALAAASQEKR